MLFILPFLPPNLLAAGAILKPLICRFQTPPPSTDAHSPHFSTQDVVSCSTSSATALSVCPSSCLLSGFVFSLLSSDLASLRNWSLDLAAAPKESWVEQSKFPLTWVAEDWWINQVVTGFTGNRKSPSQGRYASSALGELWPQVHIVGCGGVRCATPGNSIYTQSTMRRNVQHDGCQYQGPPEGALVSLVSSIS